MYEIRTQRLSLAAFMQVNGAELIAVRGRDFVMRSDESSEQWNLRWANAVENKYNAALIQLQELRRDQFND